MKNCEAGYGRKFRGGALSKRGRRRSALPDANAQLSRKASSLSFQTVFITFILTV